ncbi:META domain-containing protein [uncultured Dokdonia sp.]|uniref:META domain-containing protein n=1 Tax=uncultured Dokdonia sp. TaxID=575653 RepID=UPI0026091622|nr:META domain-containing protein [uncultured Dokdonia sp.]
MKQNIHYIIIFLLCTFYASAQEQSILTLEVAPYLVPCEDSDPEEMCLQLLSTNGEDLFIITTDAIEGFIAESGFEYTLEVQVLPKLKEDDLTRYQLQKVISKIWVPQYAVDAPELKGSFKVVGINGLPLNPNQTELIINANNSVMRGSTECNNYHLFFKQFGYSLVFSKILTTDLFCASRRPLQDEYFIVFNRVHHFEFKGDVLKLYDFNDTLVLEANLLR